MSYDLNRFVKAQMKDFNIALSEIKNGRKESHWMWYIFPQIKGLGSSFMAEHYAIESMDEAKAYLDNEYLNNNLVEICSALLGLKSDNIGEIMGYPDNLKLKSSMTLFAFASSQSEIFDAVLKKFYNGEKDKKTINILENK